MLLTGDLKSPGELTVQQLAAMPQQTVEVNFQTGKGPETHTETGVLPSALIPLDALATKDGVKSDLLAFGVLAIASDDYAALVAYGEVSSDFGNTRILLATSEDGMALERPRLIAPGDVKGGRYVTDVIELRVTRNRDRLTHRRPEPNRRPRPTAARAQPSPTTTERHFRTLANGRAKVPFARTLYRVQGG
ncbi:MAG: hypothetical protein ACRDRK_02470 [Pseudonocardia sp.]